MFTVGILTISDSVAQGKRDDEAGPIIRQMLQAEGYDVVAQRVAPDDVPTISKILIQWIDRASVDLVITTGGTGLSPRDVTPEATRQVIETEVMGISEAIRHDGLAATPRAMLSRGISGIRGQALIINLPGSPAAVHQGLGVIIPVLKHGLQKIKGDSTPCHRV